MNDSSLSNDWLVERVFLFSLTNRDGCSRSLHTSSSSPKWIPPRPPTKRPLRSPWAQTRNQSYIIWMWCRLGNTVICPPPVQITYCYHIKQTVKHLEETDNTKVSPLHHNMLCESDNRVWSCIPAFYISPPIMDPPNDSLWLHYLDGIKRRKEAREEGSWDSVLHELWSSKCCLEPVTRTRAAFVHYLGSY